MRDLQSHPLENQANLDLTLLERFEDAIRMLNHVQSERDDAQETIKNQQRLLQQYNELLETHRVSLNEHRELTETQAGLLITKERLLKESFAVNRANRRLMAALITARKVL